jgi:hypothetical protein
LQGVVCRCGFPRAGLEAQVAQTNSIVYIYNHIYLQTCHGERKAHEGVQQVH